MTISKISHNMHRLKTGLIMAWCLIAVHTLSAQNLDVSRTTTTKIADILNRFPAIDSNAFNTVMTQMAAFEEEELTQMALMLTEEGNNDNLEYALSGFAFYVSEDEGSESANKAVHAYGKALEEIDFDEGKSFLIERLRNMGNNDAVPYLTSYLLNTRLSSPAARALVSINSPDAELALLTALENSDSDTTLLPLIEALGDIKSETGANLIEPYVTSDDQNIRKVAIYSLANIGAASSAKTLTAAAKRADFKYEETNASSEYLNYIKNLADHGDTRTALKLAQKLHKASNNQGQFHTKTGALNLLIALDPSRAPKMLQKAAQSSDLAYRNAAMALAVDNMSTDLDSWTKILKKAGDDVKVDLLRHLGELQGDKFLNVVRPYLQSSNSEVKKQAVASAVLLGNNEILSDLLSMINDSSKDEVVAIKNALLIMTGDNVSSEVAKALPQASDQAKLALIEVLAARPSDEHLDVVLQDVNSTNPEVKTAALGALYRFSSPSHLPQLVELLKSQQDPQELEQVQQAIIAANSREADQAKKTAWTLKTIQSLDNNKQVYLYDVLAATGGMSALHSLYDIYRDGDAGQKEAALKALANWTDPEAMEVLYEIASTTSNQEYSDTALQGYINLIKTAPGKNEGKVLLLRKAMEVAKDSKTRQLILRQLAQYPTFQALLVAGSYLDDATVQQQAARAAMEIALADPSIDGEKVREIVEKTKEVISGTDSEYFKTSLQKHLDEMPQGRGFYSLFNGQNLDGWKGLVANPIKRAAMSPATLKREQEKADKKMLTGWKAEDGLLVFTGEGDNLVTEKKFGDFEMFVDWKITEDGDAGIYLRGTPQVQIWDIARVDVGAEVGSGGLYNNETHPSKPSKVADNPVGEWNTFHIIMKGDRVTVELNGERVVDDVVLENFWDRSMPLFPEEQIELQAHGTYVAYRDIYIKELSGGETFELSEEEKQEGFEVLFDGQDLDQWTGNKTDYVIENGEIVIYPDRGGKGNLFTKDEYSDFIFRFEFKLTPGANNGLGIRAPLQGDAAYAGMELQILDNTADIYKNLEEYQFHGSLYGIAAAKRGHLKPVGEWNYEEVRVKGDNIVVELNGTVILDVNIAEAREKGTMDKREHSGLNRKSGHIGFLGHGDVVYFKNIRVKDLSK